MTDDGFVDCCPFCSSSSISHSQARAAETPERAWLCGDCRRNFEAPDRRAQKWGNSSLATKLLSMDQDDLPRGTS